MAGLRAKAVGTRNDLYLLLGGDNTCLGSQSQLISGVQGPLPGVLCCVGCSAARGLPELPCGARLPCPVIAGEVVCDGLWDGCLPHRSCRLGARCCARHPWEICALADWTLGDLEPFDVHSLGEALRGYLQDLPSPVVPVSVHGDILRVLQGKGFP